MGPADKKKGYFRFWFFAIQFHLSIVVICSGGFAVGVSLWGKGPGQGKWTDGWSDVCARSEKKKITVAVSLPWCLFFFFLVIVKLAACPMCTPMTQDSRKSASPVAHFLGIRGTNI